jgi:hypothetical protein
MIIFSQSMPKKIGFEQDKLVKTNRELLNVGQARPPRCYQLNRFVACKQRCNCPTSFRSESIAPGGSRGPGIEEGLDLGLA